LSYKCRRSSFDGARAALDNGGYDGAMLGEGVGRKAGIVAGAHGTRRAYPYIDALDGATGIVRIIPETHT
jgi:hypothetical protein